MEAVKPQMVVISVGEENRFGHPSSEVMERYAAYGLPVLRTDQQGMIELITDGKQLITHLIFQLVEKGSLFRQAFPEEVGSLKNIAFHLLETWCNLRLNTTGLVNLFNGKFQIRFDSS